MDLLDVLFRVQHGSVPAQETQEGFGEYAFALRPDGGVDLQQFVQVLWRDGVKLEVA